mmetsp:Transcript_7746/g.24119  ORF Transcript_7746/g.24119 Transcript_7746/m.24119 type:complete len:257 (-) Transcript_7746:563-1333(-)
MPAAAGPRAAAHARPGGAGPPRLRGAPQGPGPGRRPGAARAVPHGPAAPRGGAAGAEPAASRRRGLHARAPGRARPGPRHAAGARRPALARRGRGRPPPRAALPRLVARPGTGRGRRSGRPRPAAAEAPALRHHDVGPTEAGHAEAAEAHVLLLLRDRPARYPRGAAAALRALQSRGKALGSAAHPRLHAAKGTWRAGGWRIRKGCDILLLRRHCPPAHTVAADLLCTGSARAHWRYASSAALRSCGSRPHPRAAQ